MPPLSLVEVLQRIAARQADAEYIEVLFTRGAWARPEFRLALNSLSETQASDFVAAIFKHYLPASWPVAWQLWDLRRDLKPAFRTAIEVAVEHGAPALTDALRARAKRLEDEGEKVEGQAEALLVQLRQIEERWANAEKARLRLTELELQRDALDAQIRDMEAVERKVAEVKTLVEKSEARLADLRLLLGPWKNGDRFRQLPVSLAGQLQEIRELLADDPGQPASLGARIAALRQQLLPHEGKNAWSTPATPGPR